MPEISSQHRSSSAPENNEKNNENTSIRKAHERFLNYIVLKREEAEKPQNLEDSIDPHYAVTVETGMAERNEAGKRRRWSALRMGEDALTNLALEHTEATSMNILYDEPNLQEREEFKKLLRSELYVKPPAYFQFTGTMHFVPVRNLRYEIEGKEHKVAGLQIRHTIYIDIDHSIANRRFTMQHEMDHVFEMVAFGYEANNGAWKRLTAAGNKKYKGEQWKEQTDPTGSASLYAMKNPDEDATETAALTACMQFHQELRTENPGMNPNPLEDRILLAKIFLHHMEHAAFIPGWDIQYGHDLSTGEIRRKGKNYWFPENGQVRAATMPSNETEEELLKRQKKEFAQFGRKYFEQRGWSGREAMKRND